MAKSARSKAPEEGRAGCVEQACQGQAEAGCYQLLLYLETQKAGINCQPPP